MILRFAFSIAFSLCIAGIFAGSGSAFWQSRDPNYNISISGGGGSEQTVLIDAQVGTTLVGPSPPGITQSDFSLATPINVGSGTNGTANMVLMAALAFTGAASGTSTSPSLIWDCANPPTCSTGTNQSMTLLPTTNHIGNGNAGDVYVFYLLNPTLGSKVFNVSWTGPNQVVLAAASFVNVDQTGGATTFPNIQTSTGTGTTASVSISTSPTTRKIFGAFVSAGNFSAASGTDIGHNNTSNLSSAAANWDVGTATSVSYTASSAVWAALGVVLKGH